MELLIPEVPDEVVAALDAAAKRLGTTRAELVRRTLAKAFPQEQRTMTVADLAEFSETFAGLADPQLMAEAWSCRSGTSDRVSPATAFADAGGVSDPSC